MANLALTYYDNNKWEDAEKLEAQVLELRTGILVEEHQDTITAMGDLAVTYYGQKKWADADNLLAQVLELGTRILGEEHPDTITAMGDLAATYYGQKKWVDAENLLVQVLELRTRILGEEHPDTITAMYNLAMTYKTQKKRAEAEKLDAQIPNFAAKNRDTRKWGDAETLGVQALELTTKILGEEHPVTIDTMANLARRYRLQGRWADAEKLVAQVLKRRTRVLGEEHPDTIASKTRLESLRVLQQEGLAETHIEDTPATNSPESHDDHKGWESTPHPSPAGNGDSQESEDTRNDISSGNSFPKDGFFNSSHHFVISGGTFSDNTVSVQIQNGNAYFLAAGGIIGWVIKAQVENHTPATTVTTNNSEIKIQQDGARIIQIPAHSDKNIRIEISPDGEVSIALSSPADNIVLIEAPRLTGGSEFNFKTEMELVAPSVYATGLQSLSFIPYSRRSRKFMSAWSSVIMGMVVATTILQFGNASL